MQQWWTVLGAVLAVYTVIGVGAVARRARWLTEHADHSLLRVVVNILMPALILHAVTGNRLLMEARSFALPPLVGFATVVVGFAIASAVARSMGARADLHDHVQRRTFAVCVGLYNYGYIPLPLAMHLFPGQFGDDVIAVLFVHNLGVEVALWTLGVLMMSGQLGAGWYRRLVNPPTLAIAAAMVLNFTGGHRHIPDFAHKAMEMLGVSAIPLVLLLIGAIIMDDLRQSSLLDGWRIVAWASMLRLGALPVLFLLLAWALPAGRELKAVIALEAAMASAVFPVVMARHFGGHPPTAVRVVVGTSLLSLVTTPLWLSAGLWWLGLYRP